MRVSAPDCKLGDGLYPQKTRDVVEPEDVARAVRSLHPVGAAVNPLEGVLAHPTGPTGKESDRMNRIHRMAPIRAGSCCILSMEVIHAPTPIGSGVESRREACLAERGTPGLPKRPMEDPRLQHHSICEPGVAALFVREGRI